MGLRSFEQDAKSRHRTTFNCTGVSGDYCSERITIAVPQSLGMVDQSLIEVTALAESFVPGATVELWLPQIFDSTLSSPSSRTDANFYNSGLSTLTASGAVRWLLSAWPGAQIRVKSGSNLGAMTISASAF